MQGMLDLTKEKISSELGIPLDRIAFVFQEQFHIDMELFPVSSPRGDLVFLHDEKLMLDVQRKSIGVSPLKAPFLAEKTLMFSFLHLDTNQKILAYNTKELERIDCKAVRVPGVLTAQYREGEKISYSYVKENWMRNDYNSLLQHRDSEKLYESDLHRTMVNFMNGLYFPGPSPFFITGAPPKGSLVSEKLTNAFKEVINEEYPELKISCILQLVPDILIEC